MFDKHPGPAAERAVQRKPTPATAGHDRAQKEVVGGRLQVAEALAPAHTPEADGEIAPEGPGALWDETISGMAKEAGVATAEQAGGATVEPNEAQPVEGGESALPETERITDLRTTGPVDTDPSTALDPAEAPQGSRHAEDEYRIPPKAREHLRIWRKTNPALSVSISLRDHAGLIIVAAIHFTARSYAKGTLAQVLVWAIGYGPALILIARQMRAQEALVHEASHYNWTRRKWLNDLLGNAFAGLSVFQSVQHFRPGHNRHHAHLGEESDPCYVRAMRLWQGLDRSSASKFAAGLARTFIEYNASWFELIGTRRRVLYLGLAWHAGVFVLPTTLLIHFLRHGSFGSALVSALALWVAYVALPFFTVLPAMRDVAESGKHNYSPDVGPRNRTISNIGVVHAIVHPNADAFHALHHADPAIVHHQARRAHVWLLRNDRLYVALPVRHHILEEPALVPGTSGR